MDVKTIPAMKPVLVEKVSDNINVLLKGDVDKQKTVFTARAMEDMFKCAPFSQDNEFDKQFYDDDGVVNLDKITVACSRYLEANKYRNITNKVTADQVDTSISAKWSAAHSPRMERRPDAFLYVFSVLDTSEMTWSNYDGTTSIPDTLDRSITTRAKSKYIKQIFVPNVKEEVFSDVNNRHGKDEEKEVTPYTYIARYNYSGSWYRVGTLNDDGSTYTWDAWYKVTETHRGAEYAHQIILNTAGMEITNPLYDAVYHVYNKVNSFTLPNANLDGYLPGMKIAVEVHPPITDGATSSCRVLYTDTNNVGENADSDTMNILITPKTRRNTKDIYGTVRDSVLLTSLAVFEIVEITDPVRGKIRTWELDGGIEETDFTAGLAQMLGEHTDLATGDLVNYQGTTYASQSTIDIYHPVTTSGYGVVRFLLDEACSDTNWNASVDIVNPNSEAAFIEVDTTTTPDPTKVYYIKEGTTWSIAPSDGHPTTFLDEYQYYYLDLTSASTEPIIQIVDSVSIRTSIKMSDLTVGEMRGFYAFAHRGSIIHIHIDTGSSKTTADFQGIINPLVFFFPDAHDSYIQKAAINPKAYTYSQLEKLFATGGVISDINLAISSEITQGLMNCPASTRALIEAYTYLATKLQNKGLLLGNREELNVGPYGFDALTTPGSYFVTPLALATDNTFPPNFTLAGCNLAIIGNDHAPATYVHEEDGTITSSTQLIQIAMNIEQKESADYNTLIVYTRIGTLDTKTNVWSWTPWVCFTDWDNIRNKPLYYHARWDYFEDPDALINKVDFDTDVSIQHNGTCCEVVANIAGADDITRLMQSYDQFDDTLKPTLHPDTPEYQSEFRYQIPQFLVGVNELITDAWKSQMKTGETGLSYVAKVTLPAATTSQLLPTRSTTTEEIADLKNPPDRRRKIRFLLHNTISEDRGWANVIFRASFANASGTADYYNFECIWGGYQDSSIILEFEQVDLPTGERVWSPHTVG